MSPPDDLDDPQDTEPEQPKRNFRRELEERAAAAEQKASRLERENAIFKAGLTGLTDRQISVLASQIEGDPTPESVKTLAAELGWAPAVEEGVPQQEMDDLDRVTSASVGAQTAGNDPFAVLDGIDDPEAFWRQAQANGLTTS